MIAGDGATVTELNRRARTARVAERAVAESGFAIADGQKAGVGDEIVTRQNNRLLTTGKSWVKTVTTSSSPPPIPTAQWRCAASPAAPR
jgi:hypothetical protein